MCVCVCVCVCVCAHARICVFDLVYWLITLKTYMHLSYARLLIFLKQHLKMVLIFAPLKKVKILGTLFLSTEKLIEAVMFSDYSSPFIWKITLQVLIWYHLIPGTPKLLSYLFSKVQHSSANCHIRSPSKQKGR